MTNDVGISRTLPSDNTSNPRQLAVTKHRSLCKNIAQVTQYSDAKLFQYSDGVKAPLGHYRSRKERAQKAVWHPITPMPLLGWEFQQPNFGVRNWRKSRIISMPAHLKAKIIARHLK